MKRVLCLLLTCILCLGLVACTDAGKNDETSVSSVDTTVEKAINLLKAKWIENYSEHQTKAEAADKYLEIKNTRVITIKSNDDDNFKDISKIVDFMLLDNYYLSSPLYLFNGTDSNVIFYRDGRTEVCSNYFKTVFGKTYSSDFSDIIEAVDDLGGTYNAIYHLESDTKEECKTSSKQYKEADWAVDLLKGEWSQQYEKLKVKDKYLEIKNTRIINIKENDSEYFKNIDKVVEFMVLENFLQASPLYLFNGVYFDVILYRDGSTEVANSYFKQVIKKTYESNFSKEIESIDDLGDTYNTVYHL